MEEETMNVRTISDVEHLLDRAKLDKDHFLPETQVLSFPDNFGDKHLQLLEVDKEILDYITEGNRVTIRGVEEDHAILCTDSKSFDVIEAETSNVYLMCPGLKITNNLEESDTRHLTFHSVDEIHSKYFEVKSSRPRFVQLFNLLNESLFMGPTEEDSNSRKYTFENLLHYVQCSETELEQKLCDIYAYQIDNFWRLLDFDYHYTVLSHILNLIDSNSWNVNCISKRETLNTLKGLEPDYIMEQCFDYFFEKVQTECQENSDVYKIKPKLVSRFCAEVLLKPTKKFNLTEFVKIWQQSVPEGVETDLSDLRGLALVDKESSPPLITYFPVSKLPSNLSERIDVLFDTLSKWTFQEIEPYISEFATKTCTEKSLLYKFTRMGKQGDKEYYVKRHSR